MDPTTWGAPYETVVLALFCIVMLRANGTYWLGRALRAGAHRTRLASLMDSPRYGRAVARINAWGPPAVTVSFLTIGIQTVVNLAAGATRMSLWRYLPAVTLGSGFWAFLYATAGFVGIDAWQRAWSRSPALATVVLVLLAAGLAWFVTATLRRRVRGAS